MRPLYSIGRSSQSADYVQDDIPKQHSKEQPADPVDESSESNLVIFSIASIILILTIQWHRKLVKPAVPVNRKQVR